MIDFTPAPALADVVLTTRDVISLAALAITFAVAVLGLLGWAVRILTMIQVELAKMRVELMYLSHRVDKIEEGGE